MNLHRLCPLIAIACALPGCRTPDSASEPKGGISSLGVPGPAFIDIHQNVLFQEYWQGGAPHYLIANLRPDDAVVGVTLNDKALPVQPWTVPAHQSVTVDAAQLVQEADEHGHTPALAFALSDGTKLGTLHAPAKQMLAPPPAAWSYEQPLDGMGAGLDWAGVAAMTDGQPVNPGQQGIIHLVLAKGAGDVKFSSGVKAEAPQLPMAHVLSATSATFQIKKDGDTVTIVNPKSGDKPSSDRGTVDVTFEIPAGADGPMAEFVGDLSLGGWSTSISYGIPLATPTPAP